MQLGDNHTFGTIDDESALRGHIRNHAQIHMLLQRLEILVFRIFATQFHLGFQRHTVGQAAINTLLDGIAGRIDVIIQEFEFEIVSRIGDREILLENLVKAFIQAVVGIGLDLEKVFEGLNLDIQKIGVFKFSYRSEIYYCGFFFCQGTIKLYRVL